MTISEKITLGKAMICMGVEHRECSTFTGTVGTDAISDLDALRAYENFQARHSDEIQS